MTERICSHCGWPAAGLAQVNDDWLCHPDEGPDCYGLVTVHGHPMPCPDCPGEGGRMSGMVAAAHVARCSVVFGCHYGAEDCPVVAQGYRRDRAARLEALLAIKGVGTGDAPRLARKTAQQ